MDHRGAAAVAGLAGFMLAAGSFGAAVRTPGGAALVRAAATRALLPPLTAWDALHERLDGHRYGARKPRRADFRPLRVQAAEMRADLRRRFLLGGGLLLISTPPVEIGDACLWQGVYAATAALEYDLARTPEARRRAEAAFDGLALLATRGRPIARAVLPVGVRTENPGRWYYKNERIQWKEDASVDSAAGWMFGALVTAELVPSRREQALDAVQRFVDGVAAGGFVLRNSDGSPTRFGSVGGDLVNSPVGLLVTLSGLRALARAGRGASYAELHARFVAEGQHRWAAYASGPAPWRNVTTNHNIAFLGLASALLTEDDPQRAALYGRGLLRLERITDKMDNAFWIYLTEWALTRNPELAPIVAVDPRFRRHREGRADRWERARRAMLEWHYPHNKLKLRRRAPQPGERELALRPSWAGPETPEPLPIWQRPAADFVWQRSPYRLDDWQGVRMSRSRGQSYAPLDFLSAYALGRAVGALSPDE